MKKYRVIFLPDNREGIFNLPSEEILEPGIFYQYGSVNDGQGGQIPMGVKVIEEISDPEEEHN